MKKSKIVLSVLSAFALTFSVCNIKDLQNVEVLAVNDTNSCNGALSGTQEAVEVTYSGKQTTVYGVQAYAGLEGEAWIVGNVAAVLEDGTSSHALGSNASDGRSNLKVTFKVNSQDACDAYLGVFIENDDNNSKATLKINDGEDSTIDFKQLTGTTYSKSTPAMIPVTLVAGSNTITITMQENYTAWFHSFFVSNVASYVEDLPYNSTKAVSCEISETEAIEVAYTGETTKVYGIQSYAGLSGPAWIVEKQAPVLEDGSTAHSLGSNASDGRSNLQLTFKINSTVAGDAYLNVYAELHENASTATGASLNVNGTSSLINFYELNNVTWNMSIPTKIPVTLVEGLNTITITLQGNYELWVASWSVSPQDAAPTYYDYSKVSIGLIDSKTGDISCGADYVGLNAFDKSADYGKTGSVTYKFTCEEAGEYYIKTNVMAGSNLANRAVFTLNDVIYQENGKNYVSFSTAAGWSGDSTNTYKVSLQEGLNTLTIANSLTCVNSDKSAEVEEGTDGAVYVSNWWMHTLLIEKVPSMELLLDTSNAKTLFNVNREFTSEGLKVSYKENDEVRVLTSDEYVIDSSAYDFTKFGSYDIVVTKKDDSSVSASYLVSVGDNGQEFEGSEVSFAGKATGLAYSFYNNAKIEGEGTGDCEGRIFWYNTSNVLLDGGYEMGSQGAGEYENRQVTLTLKINSSVAGDYALLMEVLTKDRNNATLSIKVNDEDAINSSLYYAGENNPYKCIVTLKEGLNTIKLTTPNQYNFWFRNFGLAPISSSNVGDTLQVKDAYREGAGIIDPDANSNYKTTSQGSTLTFFYNVEEEGAYVLNLNASTSSEKECKVLVDGVSQDVKVVSGTTKVYSILTSGLHCFKIVTAANASSDFSLASATLEKDIRPSELILDTSEANLTIPYDGILDTTTIKVSLKYTDGTVSKLSKSEFSIVKDSSFSATKPGEYTFSVVLKEDESIVATFKVVVEEEVVPEPEPQPSESITPEPEVSDSVISEPEKSDSVTEKTSDVDSSVKESVAEKTSENPVTPSKKKGCKGAMTSSLIGLITLAGALITLKKKNK